MDYKEKYEHAMDRAKKELDACGSQDCDAARQIFRLFPELKESEDERMKNAAIRACKYMIDNFENSTKDYEDAIAWLEKQGEQKPAWSEEDKRKINRIYSILRQAADTHAFSTSCRLIGDKECIELQDFLKSLKDRVQPQPKWSEEDETMWAEISDLLWEGYKQSGSKLTWDDIRDWVKPKIESLKNRHTWKPSDLQIKALEYYTKIGCVDKEGIFGSELVKLLQELKKL